MSSSRPAADVPPAALRNLLTCCQRDGPSDAVGEHPETQRLPHRAETLCLEKKAESEASVITLFVPPRQAVSEEGVGPLGGEAGLVLAPQDPVGQRELDLGILQKESKSQIALT